MRACFKTIGSGLIFFLLGLSTSQETADSSPQCEWRTNLSTKLKSGTPPQDSDVPAGSKRCGGSTPYDANLVEATVAFIKSRHKEPIAIATVLDIIKRAHMADDWQTNYYYFARDLAKQLASTNYAFSFSASIENKVNYDALEKVIQDLRSGRYASHSSVFACVDDAVESINKKRDIEPVLKEFIAVNKESCRNNYTDLANSLAPLVLRDLRNGVSETSLFIRSVRDFLSRSPHEQEMYDFSRALKEHLKQTLAQDASLLSANKGVFLDLLVKRIENPSRPSLGYALGLLLLWLLTLANTALLAYLLRHNLKKPGLPSRPVKDPEVASLARSVENLSALQAKSSESINLLEKRLINPEAPPGTPWTGAADLRERLGSIERAYQQVQTQLGQWSSKLSGPEERPPAPPTPPDADQFRLSRDVDLLKGQFRALYKMMKTPSESSPEPTVDSIGFEREILSESWKKFRDNKDLTASIERASRDQRWQEVREPLLFQLPQAVPDELKATFDAVLAPARDYHNLITKISLVPRLVSGDLPKLESEAQEVTRIREFTHLLAMTLNSNLVADRLNFRLERWITDQFLSFADLFLQRFQQAQLEGQAAPLEAGLRIIRQVLRAANLEPIELVLGQTIFDSTRHIGRSTTSDTRFPDGVVMAAVRNGFMQGGQQVLRQPEVIVNRVR